MKINAGLANELPAGDLFDMAYFRYRIFVERLGWQLQTHGRLELDQFDRRDTLYVIARDQRHQVVGVARLLPTHRPYLLADVFPHLLGTSEAPRSPSVWELSRFATEDYGDVAFSDDQHLSSRRSLSLLRSVMDVACAAGAQELVSVSPLAVERILRRGGISFQRMSAPVRSAGQVLFACRIDLRNSHAKAAAREEHHRRACAAVEPR